MCPLRSMAGQALLTDKASILNRWVEHFQTLFSTNHTVDDSVIQKISQQPMIEELDVAKAANHLKSGKAARINGIQPDIWKHGGKSTALQTSRALGILLGTGKTTARPSRRYHHHSVQGQRGKGRLLKPQGDNPPLHRR